MEVPNPVPPLRRLLEELRRRGVVRAAAVYTIGAWVAIQVATTAFPALYIPRTAQTVVVLAAVLGLPVTIVLAWAFEFTPEGLRRTPKDPGERPLSFRLRAFLVALVVVGTAGMGWIGWQGWIGPRAEGSAGSSPSEEVRQTLDPRRVAVLYFDDHSRGESLVHFAEGLTEHLIHRLTQVDALEVVSRHGVKPYRDGQATLDSIAGALRAGSLVEGSVQRSDGRLAVTVQLIDGETQTHLMSAALERPKRELFALQDSLAEEVSRLLRRRLGREIQLEAWKAETESVEAWELVQLARRVLEDADSLEGRGEGETARRLAARADSMLVRAGKLAPSWSKPAVLRARLAVVTVDPYAVPWSERERKAVRRGLGHAGEAVRRAPDDSEARIERGRLRFWLSQHTDDRSRAQELLAAAETDLRQAVRIDPGSARGLYALSVLLHEGRGEVEEARYFAQRAQRADAFLTIPADIHFRFFYTAFDRPDYEDAVFWCRTGQKQYPARVDFRACELALLCSSGGPAPDVERAWELVEEIRARSKPQEQAYHVGIARREVAAVLARAGLPDSARSVLKRARSDSLERPSLAYEEAHAYLLLKEEDRALERLSSYLEGAPARLADELARNPWFEPLRGDPRFADLISS